MKKPYIPVGLEQPNPPRFQVFIPRRSTLLTFLRQLPMDTTKILEYLSSKFAYDFPNNNTKPNRTDNNLT